MTKPKQPWEPQQREQEPQQQYPPREHRAIRLMEECAKKLELIDIVRDIDEWSERYLFFANTIDDPNPNFQPHAKVYVRIYGAGVQTYAPHYNKIVEMAYNDHGNLNFVIVDKADNATLVKYDGYMIARTQQISQQRDVGTFPNFIATPARKWVSFNVKVEAIA